MIKVNYFTILKGIKIKKKYLVFWFFKFIYLICIIQKNLLETLLLSEIYYKMLFFKMFVKLIDSCKKSILKLMFFTIFDYTRNLFYLFVIVLSNV